MITGMGDTKLPPFPRDSKAPLDTPPAYSERLAPAPREVYTTAAPTPHASNPFSLPSTSQSQGPPPQTQFAHGSGRPVPAPPSFPSPPSLPSPPSPPPSHPPRAADASSYQSSSTSTSKDKGKGKCKNTSASASAPGKVARAMGQGMFALVAMPVVATAAAVYGSGKLIEGIGRGLSAGPEAVLKAYRKVDGKIKGAGAGAGAQEDADAREREWHQYQYQQQQQQQLQKQQQYHQQGEWGEVPVGGPMKMEKSPVGSRSGSLQMQMPMPMKASLMEDPSIGMTRGVGSIQK